MRKGDPGKGDSIALINSMSNNVQSDFLTSLHVTFSTPYKAGTMNSFHRSESLSDLTKCHQCWVMEQGHLSPKSIFFLLQRWLKWLKYDSESGGEAKPTSAAFEFASLLFSSKNSALDVVSWKSGLFCKCPQTTGRSFVKEGGKEK